MKIHPQRMLEQFQEKMAEIESPRHRALLENVHAHVSAELAGTDVEAILKTMVPEPQFHWWGMGYGDVGPKGRDAVAEHYGRMLGKKYHIHQHEFDRIIVDDCHVVLEGPVRIVFPGHALKDMNLDIDDPEAFYLLSYQSLAVFHFDDQGNCTGEDSYSDGMPVTMDRVKKLSYDNLPEEIRNIPDPT